MRVAHKLGRFTLCILLGLATLALADTGALVEYLYIDANEDQASGGHTAMRIGSDVFHFQYDAGMLTMARDDWADFQLSYRGYQNRNIRAERLAVSEDTHKRLRSSFVRRHITQTGQLDLLADTRRDLALAQALSRQPADPIVLPGFGFFQYTGVGQRSSQKRPLLLAIEQKLGADYLLERRAVLERQITSMVVEPLAITDQDYQPGRLPFPRYAFNQRYADALAGILAIDMLYSGAGLSEDALVLAQYASADMALLPVERAFIQTSSLQLQQRLVALAQSRRPDWGQPFLLGMARLEAMRESLRRNAWVFINILDTDAAVVEVGSRTRQLLPLLQDDALALWRDARERWLTTEGWNEPGYAKLEAASANWQELLRVQAGADDWRIRDTKRSPRGIGRVRKIAVPAAFNTANNNIVSSMELAHQTARKGADELLAYKLFTRNCVSELFTTVDLALEKSLEQRGELPTAFNLQAETEQRLGYRFEPSPIPFRSAAQVRKHWRVAEDRELPSLRKLYTRAQYQETPRLSILLRESNTLTSSVYQRSDDDSFFVFFTDGNALVRPVLGVVNLTAALGATLVGTVQWPFDNGKQLSAGARGALFSLPELGFLNIRKGTNAWIAPGLREVELE